MRARQADRRHRRIARRERPRRGARRRRAEARCRTRHRAEPAPPPHRAADELWRQHAGAEWRPARAVDPARRHRRLCRVPRGGDHPAHQLPARQGARAGAHPARPVDRGRQSRRDHRADPRRARPGDGARRASSAGAWPAADVAPLVALVGEPGRERRRGRHLSAVRRAGARDPRSAAAAPDRARTRQDRRGTARTDRRDRRLSRDPALARAADRGAARRAAGDQGAVRHAAADPDRGCRVRGRHRGADPARGRWW